MSGYRQFICFGLNLKVFVASNTDKVTKIVQALNLKIPLRDLKSKDTRQLLSLIFGQWLSLSTCTIQTVVDVIRSPSQAQRIRIPKMLYPDLNESTVEPKNKLERDLFSCNARSDAFVAAYVSKMFAVSRKDLPESKRKPLTAHEMRDRAHEALEPKEKPEAEYGSVAQSSALQEELSDAEGNETCLLGFARLYSGTVRVGATVYCVLPKYNGALDPTHARNSKHILTAKVEALYTMMGRDLVPVESVRAGNVFAIKGLEGKVWRSATLCAPKEDGVLSKGDVVQDKECLLNLGGLSIQVRGACFHRFFDYPNFNRRHHQLCGWPLSP